MLESRRLLTAVTINEFPTPTVNSDPGEIAAGPDGNLWFTEADANQIGEINPATHAIQEFSIPTVNSEPEGITAGPDGNLWFTEADANQIGEVQITTTQAATVTTVASSSDPSTYGQAVTFTATVLPQSGSGTPTGTVQFQIDGANFGSPVTLNNRSATSGSISTLTAGNHTITATYSGAATLAPSTAPSVTQTVQKDNVTVNLTGVDKSLGQRPGDHLHGHRDGSVSRNRHTHRERPVSGGWPRPGLSSRLERRNGDQPWHSFGHRQPYRNRKLRQF